MAKAISKKSKSTSPVVELFMAEDFRQELNGKITAVGLYVDRVVIVGLADDVPSPTRENPRVIVSLGFLFNISNLNGSAEVSVDVLDENGTTQFLIPQVIEQTEPGRSTSLVGVVQPFPIASFGKKTLLVHVGPAKFTFDYEIRRASIPAPTGSIQDHVDKAPPKTRIGSAKKLPKSTATNR